jgi:hypothetical protein
MNIKLAAQDSGREYRYVELAPTWEQTCERFRAAFSLVEADFTPDKLAAACWEEMKKGVVVLFDEFQYSSQLAVSTYSHIVRTNTIVYASFKR